MNHERTATEVMLVRAALDATHLALRSKPGKLESDPTYVVRESRMRLADRMKVNMHARHKPAWVTLKHRRESEEHEDDRPGCVECRGTGRTIFGQCANCKEE